MQEVKLGTPISETFSLRSIIGERLLLSQSTLRNNTYLLHYTAEFGFMGLQGFIRYIFLPRVSPNSTTSTTSSARGM